MQDVLNWYNSQMLEDIFLLDAAYIINPFTSSALWYHNYLDPSISNSRASGKFILLLCFRASVKRTYDVYYALRLLPGVQTELQRRIADFQNFFCPSEIDTQDVQKLSKGLPTFNQLYDVCPAYLPEIRYLC